MPGVNLVLGPDRAIWFAEPEVRGLGRITSSGQYSDLRAGLYDNPEYIAAGPDGNMWFTEHIGYVGRMTLTGVATQFEVPSGPNTQLRQIAAGSDGALWFGEPNIGIGRITTDGTITEFSAPFSDGLARGPDGNIWFCSSQGMARITPTGMVQIGPAGCGGTSTVGLDGDVWSVAGGAIYRITPDFAETAFPFNISGGTIAAGLDGNVWVLTISSEQKPDLLTRVTHNGTMTTFTIPAGGSTNVPPNPGGLATGSDGSLWFSDPDDFQVGRFEVDTLAIRPLKVSTVHGVTAVLTVARMFDTDLVGIPSDYLVIIRWGDGTYSLGAAIGSNPFAVIGRHSYGAPGTYRVAVAIADRDHTFGRAISGATVT